MQTLYLLGILVVCLLVIGILYFAADRLLVEPLMNWLAVNRRAVEQAKRYATEICELELLLREEYRRAGPRTRKAIEENVREIRQAYRRGRLFHDNVAKIDDASLQH